MSEGQPSIKKQPTTAWFISPSLSLSLSLSFSCHRSTNSTSSIMTDRPVCDKKRAMTDQEIIDSQPKEQHSPRLLKNGSSQKNVLPDSSDRADAQLRFWQKKSAQLQHSFISSPRSAYGCHSKKPSCIFHARQQKKGKGLSLVVGFTTPNSEGNIPGSLPGRGKGKVSTLTSTAGAKSCDTFFSSKT